MSQPSASPVLGTENIKKLMLKLAVPAVLAQVVNLLYNIVDRIYIGHIPVIGADALTGVGLFNAILMLLTAFAVLFGSGGAPLAAIAMGRREKEKAEQIMGNCFTMLLLTAVLLTAVLLYFCADLLCLFGASEDTLPYALEYGRIYIGGSIFVLFVMGMNPFITTQGFAKFSMLTTIIGAICNIILDPIFIFALDLGVAGAAWATVISQAISAVWILLFLTGKTTTLKLKVPCMKLKKNIIFPCMGLGVSTFVMMSTESLLSISFTSSLARYGGDLAVGTMTILASLNQLLFMPLSGICQGGQPIISYNFGAGNNKRVKEAFFTQLAACLGYIILFWLPILIFPAFFSSIFTPDAELARYSSWAIRIFFACGFSMALQNCCQQSFMALGQAKVSLIMACLRKLVLLIPLIFILPNFFENKVFAVFLAEPVSDLTAAAITTIVFLTSFGTILKNGPQKNKS